MKFTWNIQHEGEVSDIIRQLLANRGVTDEAEIASFLHPDWEKHTHDPFLFTQMTQAVDLVFKHLKAGNNIVIHGDYDADGVSGSTVLYTTIKEIAEHFSYAINLDVFLPDRERDGYGVAMHTVERMVHDHVDLIITVDCGIANATQLDYAGDKGVDVIICDHHQLAPELPKHAVIIHPLAPGESYPNKHLCGTGVAFKLASALIIEARKQGFDVPEGYEKWLLDLVAIATVTDVMPLLGENRVLEYYGLKVLNKTKRQGIKQIVDLSRAEMGSLDTQSIGFQIGPRINAAGRIHSAKAAFDTLAAQDSIEALGLAQTLEQLNRERQRVSEAAYKEARVMAKEVGEVPIHVVWNETWHPGIVGLIAGKLVTEFGVPAFALTRVGEHFVGSGRSVGGLHLVEAMRSCGDIFIKAGGHPQACGLSIATEDLVQEFQKGVTTFATEYFSGEIKKPALQIDFAIPLADITWDVFDQLQALEPYGEKNPHPVFLSRNVRVHRVKAVGRNNAHLSLQVIDGLGNVWRCIGFGFGELEKSIAEDDIIDMVYEVALNEWNGNKSLQCRIHDIKYE